MKYVKYMQNNSGGVFHEDEKIAPNVIIEAESLKEADEIAESIGLYFNSYAGKYDCPCCGERWDSAVDFGTLEERGLEELIEREQILADKYAWYHKYIYTRIIRKSGEIINIISNRPDKALKEENKIIL